MSKLKRIASMAAALTVGISSLTAMPKNNSVDAAYGVGGTGNNVVEYLDRGINAINTGNGMFVSWRWNANDADDAEFRLYRDNNLIYTSKSGDATSYLDKDGKSSSKYRVDTLSGGKVVSSDECKLITNQNYFNIPLKKPGSNYTPNDCSVGDVDGDGQYEIFLKWDPSNSKDNSQEGKTDNVYIDCYTLEGKQLWRIDLGKNIRAGQHYTQFIVADFDLDGKAEMTCKTADGTVDGTGKVIGDASKDYRNSKGYVLDGPEYYTLFDGATGKALDTVNYEFPRGKVSDWGDNYGNRVDRFLGTAAYLDGVRPSAVSVRGYYTRMTLVAYDVVDKKLKVKWKYDSGNDKKKGYGGGNHNCMPADVDNDGKQEIFLGATCIDHDGKLLWANGKGHGDAMHLGDLDPDRPGLEAWVCHEESSQGGVSLLDAKTGEVIFHKHTGKDTGRCAGDNVYAGNKGAELWGAESNNVYTTGGKSIGTTRPAQNFLIYWDGDLEREILDGTKISKYTSPSKIDTIFTASGCTSNNGTKSVPCLTADIFGDWREELVMAASDGNSIRIYCTPTPTKVRLTTLMHDVQYRMQVATEQNCYNQPPHVSYYLGSDVPLPERPNVKLNSNAVVAPPAPTEPPTPTEPPAPKGGKYIKNLEVKDTANSDDWKISESTSTGGAIFGDRDYTYISLPDVIKGAEAIQTACDSKNTDAVLAEFTAGADIDVYILLDTRVEENKSVPSWLNSWTKTGLTAETSNDVTFSLYKKSYKSGEKVELGTNGMSGNVINYTVFVTEANSSVQQPAVTEPPVTQPPTTQPPVTDSPVVIEGGFHVDGQKILDANNNEFIMYGLNVAHAWYQNNTEASIKASAAKGTNTIRVVCSDGVQWNKTSETEIRNIIKWCKENKQVCILEAHDATGSNNASDIVAAARYWATMADILNENKAYVILNIANEWYGEWSSDAWADGASQAIKTVRDAGIENMIMIDAAGWGQFPQSIADKGAAVFAADPLKNTVFSIHFYEYAGGTAQQVKTNIDNALKCGAPVIVGEFGYKHTDGDVAEDVVMSYCEEKGMGYLAWSWKGNSGGVEYLDLVNDWEGSSLTEWGEIFFNAIKGKAKAATVFEGSAPTPTDPTAPPASTVLWGDANCDGAVTIADATAILQYLGNKDKYPLSAQGLANADVSAPEGITANDAIVIQQVDAGIISQQELPVK